jgi:hypothetical protein
LGKLQEMLSLEMMRGKISCVFAYDCIMPLAVPRPRFIVGKNQITMMFVAIETNDGIILHHHNEGMQKILARLRQGLGILAGVNSRRNRSRRRVTVADRMDGRIQTLRFYSFNPSV